jgi:hypothetical protein
LPRVGVGKRSGNDRIPIPETVSNPASPPPVFRGWPRPISSKSRLRHDERW